MPNREQRRFPASSPVIIPGYASSESSSSQSDLSLLVCGTDPIVSIPASPTMDHMSNAALYSPKEQLVYPLKHISPAEEAAAMQEIQTPEDPEFGDAAHCRAALYRSVASSEEEPAEAGDTEDPELGDAAHCRAALHRSVASSAEEPADAGDTEDPEI